MTLIPPELDGAKRMLDQLTPHLHRFRVGLNPSLGFFNNMFSDPTGNPPTFFVAGTFFFQRTLATGTGLVVTDLTFLFNRLEAKGQGFSGWTGIGVSGRIINKLDFAKQT